MDKLAVGLTTTEQQELEYHEARIEHGLKASEEARQSLRTIREKRLYRAQYQNFEQYCWDRWGFHSRYANRLISAEETREILGPTGPDKYIDLPEWVVRPLAQLAPDQRREAWQKAVDSAPNGKVTGAHVQRVVDEFKQELPREMVYEREELNNGIVKCAQCQQLYDGTSIDYCPYCAYTREQRIQYLRHQEQLKSDANHQVHFSSETSEWYTPKHIIDRVLRVLGEIDLDPCSNSHDEPNVPAKRHYTEGDDGLTQEWHGRVYMNPPYGREISDWVNHLIREWEGQRTVEAIALVPARTDTTWFRWLRRFPRCFVFGRLRFSNSDNSAPFPSMVVYLGQNLDCFIEAFGDIGDIYQVVGHVRRG